MTSAPGRGIEPLFTDSKSAVLPLDDPGIARAVAQGFMSDWQMDMLHMSADTALLLPALVQSAGLGSAPRLDAI